jgi:O-antigen ligase
MLRESPLLGIGLDNFLYRYPAYLSAGLNMEPNLSHPHNLVLHFWLQLGLLGLVALGWLLKVFVWQTRGEARSAGDLLAGALAVGSLGSMADFAAHGLVDNSYFLVDMAFIFWLTLAVSQLPEAAARDGRQQPGLAAREAYTPPDRMDTMDRIPRS